jgi:hypothetical protein
LVLPEVKVPLEPVEAPQGFKDRPDFRVTRGLLGIPGLLETLELRGLLDFRE